ncbi:interferon gamma receptor 1-like isoform X2 [Toxotes jaculatrix]|uniref:interferon gamma receptor 1-like isoform X2 n=1 Tax=Toxotes jaculatrix TaxID=941984 RepID=UPI001B3B06D4|nr:interferon gamma receptor 1-like isoform X2 [Toxotes jaculatrix]
MDSGRFHPVFHFLVWLTVVWAHVEPPTNVTLQCHSMNNVLKWTYEKLEPGLQFCVEIRSYYSVPYKVCVDAPALQANLSALSDPDEAYLVSVTAVLGQNTSESAPPEGISFSYFRNSPESQICSLDLPPVTVTAEPDDNVAFHFIHPWKWYNQQQKKSNKKRGTENLPEFKYHVAVISQKSKPKEFTCEEDECKGEVPVDAAQEKHCLNITGDLQNMEVTSARLYCTISTPIPTGPHISIYIVTSVLVLSSVAVVLFLVYLKKTRPSTNFPKSMLINKNSPVEPPQDTFSIDRAEPCSSPSPLLSGLEESEITDPVAHPDEPEFRLPLGVSTTDEDARDVTEAGHPNGEEHEHVKDNRFDEDVTLNNNVGHSVYEKREPTLDVSHKQSEGPCVYEKRPVLVELAPGELAEGYHGVGNL